MGRKKIREDPLPIFSFRSEVVKLTNAQIKCLIEEGAPIFQLLMQNRPNDARLLLKTNKKLFEAFQQWVQ